MSFRLIWAISALALGSAWALHPISSHDRERIEGFLEVSRSNDTEIGNAVDKQHALEKRIDILSSLTGYEGDVREDRVVLAKIKQEIREKTDRRDVARDKAIHLALTAYGLAPADRSGTPIMPAGTSSMNDAMNGRNIRWTPVAQDRTEYWALGRNGEQMHDGPPEKNVGALTYTNGITRVFDGAFESPEVLATILLHESIHFEQFATGGRFAEMSFNEREVDAWTATSRQMDDLGFGSDENRALRQRLVDPDIAFYSKGVAKERSPFGRSRGFFGKPPDNSASNDASGADEARARFDDIGGVMAEENARVREQSRRERLVSARDAIMRVSRQACDDPDSVDQAALDSLPRSLETNALLGAMPDLDESDGRERCLINAYSAISFALGAGRDVEVYDVRFAARPESSMPPAVVRPVPKTPILTPDECGRQMADLARTACQNPDGLSERDLDLVNRWFPDRRCSVSISADWDLTLCPFNLFKWLRDENDRSLRGQSLTIGWVRSMAGQFQRESEAKAAPRGALLPRRDPDDGPDPDRGCHWVDDPYNVGGRTRVCPGG